VLPYANFLTKTSNHSDQHLNDLFRGLISRQAACVNLDPFANAYNKEAAPSSWVDDQTFKKGFLNTQVPAMTFQLHERKYELDSLCAFMKLSTVYWNKSGDLSPFGPAWLKAIFSALQVIKAQQEPQGPLNPTGGSGYFFQREASNPTDTLMHGVGPPAKRTGMSISPFRPSDDAATLPFPTAANAMAVVALRELQTLLQALVQAGEAKGLQSIIQMAAQLEQEIDAGIQQYGVISHLNYGTIYAYEVDGFGNSYFMDDANIPSLLSLPYLGYCDVSDALYQRTRSFLLSRDNPYFFSGSAGEGIGGPHVGQGYIWPMSIMIRALTSTSDAEILQCLTWLKGSSAGTGFMHESFWQDNASTFTRPWFAWANSLFGELILELAQNKPHLIF